MPISKRLQQILRAAARISQSEAGQDSMRAEPRDQFAERPVNECVRCGHARGAGRPQLITMTPQSQAEIDSRLNDIPSMDYQHGGMTMARDDAGQALQDHFHKPWCVRTYLRKPIEIEMIAIHRRVDQRRRAEDRRQLARDRRGVEIVHLWVEQQASGLTRAATMRSDQENRSVAVNDFQPRRGRGVSGFIDLAHEA